jgi:hypothetical protein
VSRENKNISKELLSWFFIQGYVKRISNLRWCGDPVSIFNRHSYRNAALPEYE